MKTTPSEKLRGYRNAENSAVQGGEDRDDVNTRNYPSKTEIKETELDKEASFLVYGPKGTRSSPCHWHQ